MCRSFFYLYWSKAWRWSFSQKKKRESLICECQAMAFHQKDKLAAFYDTPVKESGGHNRAIDGWRTSQRFCSGRQPFWAHQLPENGTWLPGLRPKCSLAAFLNASGIHWQKQLWQPEYPIRLSVLLNFQGTNPLWVWEVLVRQYVMTSSL